MVTLLVNVGGGVVGRAEQIARSCSSGPVSPPPHHLPTVMGFQTTLAVTLDGILKSDSRSRTILTPILPL